MGSDNECDENQSVAKMLANRKQLNAQSAASASDSEDDLPIAELIAKRKREGRLDDIIQQKKKKPKTSVDNNASSSQKKESGGNKSSSSSNSSRPVSRIPTGGAGSLSAEFYTTPKGILVQTILSRWWYAIEWPKPEHIGKPPPGFEPLDGFPGVFVSTSVSLFLHFF